MSNDQMPAEQPIPDQPPFEKTPIPPELLEWARQTFNMEEHLAGVREIEATGGLRLEDFIQELEEVVRSRE